MCKDFVQRFLVRTFVVWMLMINLAACQDAASLLTGLLNTFATASRNPGCPGECRHALSAIFCSHVDEEADCGDAQLRCCTNPPPLQATRPPLPPNLLASGEVEERPGEVSHMAPDRRRPPISEEGDHTFSRPPMLGQTSPISVGTNLTVRPGDVQPMPSRTPGRPVFRPVHRRRPTPTAPSSIDQSHTTAMMVTMALAAPVPTAAALVDRFPKPPKINIPCNGICVSSMVASFCTRISESSHCSPGEVCCFTGADDPDPSSSTLLKATGNVSATTSALIQNFPTTIKLPQLTTKPATSTNFPMTVATVKPTIPTTTAAATTVTTRTVTRSKPSTAPSRSPPTTTVVTIVPPRQPEDVDGVEECPGSCVMGLLSLLCENVDESVECQNGGKCCIVKSTSDSLSSDDEAPTTKPLIEKCPGICLPSLLSGVCNRPAILIPDALDCDGGSICCDNSLREDGFTSTTTTSSPLLDMLSWPLKLGAGLTGHGDETPNSENGASGQPSSATSLLGQTIAGLLLNGAAATLGGNGGDSNSKVNTLPSNNPSPMHQPTFGLEPHLPPPLQPDINRMQGVPNRPSCPGTCIASFLKMNCFGSFQLDDTFACPKQNLVCCAPKTTALASSHDSTNEWNNSFGRFPSLESQIVSYTHRPANKYVCGMKGTVRPETPRVVGGRDASPGEWCWQVALINSLNQYLCGGALIGRQWVLTAAHCVTNLIRSGDAIYIRVGDYDLTSKYGSPGAQTLRVATTYIHHNHNSQTLDNNIALLKLEKQVELKEGVCLVCLPARGVAVEAGKRCIVTGYGYMGESGPIPLRIRQAALPIVSEQECVRKINSVTEKIFILPASSFCAGGEEGEDACQGDGGGPLSCEVDGYYEITGIVSWGFGCGRADVPGIYVKVSSFIGWINQIISVNSI